MKELPTNLAIEPITKYDLGDLGSVSNYRTNSTLNRIENSVLKNMTSQNKTLIDAIKADPTTTNSLLLTIGQGLAEDKARRELNDLRNEVRGGQVSRAREKAYKAHFDKNVKVVNGIIKDVAPNVDWQLNPNELAKQFIDPNTGTINRLELGKHLQKLDQEYRDTRPETPESREAKFKKIAQIDKMIKNNPHNLALVRALQGEKKSITDSLNIPEVPISFTPAVDEDGWYSTGSLFTGNPKEGKYKTSIWVEVQGKSYKIPVAGEDVERPKIHDGNLLTFDNERGEEVTIQLSHEQMAEFQRAVNQASQVGEIPYAVQQAKGFDPFSGVQTQSREVTGEGVGSNLTSDSVSAASTSTVDTGDVSNLGPGDKLGKIVIGSGSYDANADPTVIQGQSGGSTTTPPIPHETGILLPATPTPGGSGVESGLTQEEVLKQLIENRRIKKKEHLDGITGGPPIPHETGILSGSIPISSGTTGGVDNDLDSYLARIQKENPELYNYLARIQKENPEGFKKVMDKIASGSFGPQYPRTPGTVGRITTYPNITPDTPITTVDTGDGSNLGPGDKLGGIVKESGFYDANVDPAVIQRQIEDALANRGLDKTIKKFQKGRDAYKTKRNAGDGKRIEEGSILYRSKEFPNLTKERIGHTPDGRPIWKNEPEIDEQGRSWDSESSERAVIFKYKGKYYSYPTIFNRMVNGELVPYEITGGQAKAMAIGYKFIDPETGVKSKGFNTEEEARAYAKERSSHLGDQLVRPKVKKKKGGKSSVFGRKSVVDDMTLKTEPRSTYSRADADEQQRIDRGEQTAREENLERIARQMARVHSKPPEPSLADQAGDIYNSLKDRFASIEEVNAGSSAKEVKPRELSDEQKRNIARTEAINNIRNSGNVDDGGVLGKVRSEINALGSNIEEKKQEVKSTFNSTQEALVEKAKEFMAYKGVTGKSGNDMVGWISRNFQEFKEWASGNTTPDKVNARDRSERMQKANATGIDERYLVALAKRHGDKPLPKNTPLLKSFQRGLTLAGRSGKAKDVRPGFIVALAQVESNFDTRAEGIEMDRKGKSIKGGRVQGLGLLQMTPKTAGGTPLGKTKFKGKSDAEISRMLKDNPELNIAISTQFAQQLYNKFKTNEYTKGFSQRDMELLVGTAYNNAGESFEKAVNQIKPKNFRDLLMRAGKYKNGNPHLEGQTRTHIRRLKKALNKKYMVLPSGKKKKRPLLDRITAPFNERG